MASVVDLWAFFNSCAEHFARVLTVPVSQLRLRQYTKAPCYAFETRMGGHVLALFKDKLPAEQPGMVICFNTEPLCSAAEAASMASRSGLAHPHIVVDYSPANLKRWAAALPDTTLVLNAQWLLLPGAAERPVPAPVPHEARTGAVQLGWACSRRDTNTAIIQRTCPDIVSKFINTDAGMRAALNAAAVCVVLHRHGDVFELHRYWHFMMLDPDTVFFWEPSWDADEMALVTEQCPNVRFIAIADMGAALAEALANPGSLTPLRVAGRAAYEAARERYLAGGQYFTGAWAGTVDLPALQAAATATAAGSQ